MGKFKVGDRVRLLTDNGGYGAVGATGTALRVNCGDDDCYIRFDRAFRDCRNWYAKWSDLEALPVAAQPAAPAKFKVGDRVWAKYAAIEGLATVEAVDLNDTIMTCLVTFDGRPNQLWIYNRDIAPVAEQAAATATLTIEAGRYYTTRDGRKVGPMFTYPNGYWQVSNGTFGGGQLWQDDGVAIQTVVAWYLIAEWVEPQAEPVPVPANDDKPVIKGGVMFIGALKCGQTQRHVTKGALVKTKQGYGFELARYGEYVWVDTGKTAPICLRASTVAAA